MESLSHIHTPFIQPSTVELPGCSTEGLGKLTTLSKHNDWLLIKEDQGVATNLFTYSEVQHWDQMLLMKKVLWIKSLNYEV